MASAVTLVVLLFADQLASRELWLWKYFFFGVFISEFIDRYGHRISSRFAVGTFLVGCFLLVLDMQTGPTGSPFDWFNRLGIVRKNTAEYTVGLAWACALILVGTLRSPLVATVMSVAPLRVLGAVSYSIYLIHPFFILAVFPKLDFTKAGRVQALIEPVVYAPPWYAPTIMFPGALAWAIVCFLLVERPFLLRRPE